MRPPAAEVEALAAALAAGRRPGEKMPRVLDLGAGTGRHTVVLQDAGLDVVALDRDVESAQNLVDMAPGTEFALHDLAHPLPFAPESFAGCVLWSVLPHVTPEVVPVVLVEAGRILAHGGTLVCNFIDPRDERRDPETGLRRRDLSLGPDLFLARTDVDPHLWWGKIADAHLAREAVAGVGQTAEWRLRVVKY